ncbi:hypothetical protein [Asticcacaulis solisilvae]|uniref:hypothetical protein n=1 Tax=Asticcacaulis solisilvae TaxID=1217274 RepID=UPI003FD742E6
MNFSYTLFLVLLLISPGLAVWAGFRIGEKNDLLAQAPEKPQSTLSLIVIVFGALAGHILMAGLYVAQAWFCAISRMCWTPGFDPDVYRVILVGKAPAGISDFAIGSWLVVLLLPPVLMFVISLGVSQLKRVRNFREASTFGWLKAVVDRRQGKEGFILAYVVTSMEKDGAFVAFEGILENFAFDDNKAIAMVVLSQCERFVVRIEDGRFYRTAPSQDQNKIQLIQIEAKNFKNIALEVFDAGLLPQDVTEVQAPPASVAAIPAGPAPRPARRSRKTAPAADNPI